MKQKIFDPTKSGSRMTIVCFVSGSGTNYQKIVESDPNHEYLVFTNRPGCGGVQKARANRHKVIELSHLPYLKEAKAKYGKTVPRNAPERVRYEQDAWKLIEEKLGKLPDLICLAGYDQWDTDWMVDRYYPHILNIHPGDTTKGYDGLYWIPSAKAILAGDKDIRSTLFLVDKGEDTGPVLVQSRPLDIEATIVLAGDGLAEDLRRVTAFAKSHGLASYDAFQNAAGTDEKEMMKRVCESLQESLKVAGDWQVYPFTVHDLIGKGRVEVDVRSIYVDGKKLPEHGFRME